MQNNMFDAARLWDFGAKEDSFSALLILQNPAGSGSHTQIGGWILEPRTSL